MLLLIGLGLDIKEISVKAKEALKKADNIYLEQYTTFIAQEYLDYLKAETGKEIKVVGRSEIEEGATSTLKDAKTNTTAVLVPGDSLIATTHYATLINTANKLGIKSKVYHASSIYSAAIGESGLDVYKFGPPITIAFWSENYKPTSFIDAIRKNLRNSQHSLILLDLEQKEKRPMGLEEAITLLQKADKEKETEIISDDLKLVVLADVGKDSQDIAYASVGQLPKLYSRFSKKIIALIIPSMPSFAEQESLSWLAK